MKNKKVLLVLIALASSTTYSKQPKESLLNSLEEQINKMNTFKYSDRKKFEAIGRDSFTEDVDKLPGREELIKTHIAMERAADIESELFLRELERGVLNNLRTAFEKKDLKAVSKLIDSKVTYDKLDSWLPKTNQNLDGILLGVSGQTANNRASDKATFEKELNSFNKEFKKFDFVELKLIGFERKPMQEMDEQRTVVPLRVAFDMRGFNGKSLPKQLKGVWIIELKKEKNSYVIADWKTLTSTHLEQTKKPSFERVAGNAGFDNAKVYPRLEALRRGGYAFAIEDFDNDGILDAFVGNYAESTLWKGNKDGTFTKVDSPVNKVTLAKAAAFVDLNNNGRKDLVISRFSDDHFTGDVLVYKNTGKNFEEVPNAFPSKILREYAMPMAIGDFNKDGLVDIYIGFPGEKDFSMDAYSSGNETRKVVHGVFINKGDYKFSDETQKAIPSEIQTQLWPHGAVASDFNGDGELDIIIMDDQMNISPILKNVGNGNFKMVNQELSISNTGYGMGVAVGDVTGNGCPDILMSNATFNTEKRFNNSGMSEGWKNRMIASGRSSGLRLFENLCDGNFVERTTQAGLMDVGEGAGGVTLIDYDNDGLLDIYVVNGLWSGSSRSQTIDSAFAISQSTKITALNHMHGGLGERKRGETQSTYMKILLEERVKEDGKEKTLSFGGHQRNKLFKNLGNGKFVEVGFMEGVDSIADGYMSVVADITKNGKADLILRNCDPGATDYMFPVMEVYKNNNSNNNAIWLTLKGKRSNSMGVGAKVIATVDGKKIYREVQANNSAAQGQIVAHIGLGKNKEASEILIKWPSGHEEVLKNIKPGHHTIEEGDKKVASR